MLVFQACIFVFAWNKGNRKEHHPKRLCVTRPSLLQENLLVSYNTEEDHEIHFPESPVSLALDYSMDYSMDSMDSMDDWHYPNTGMDWTSYIRDMASSTLIQLVGETTFHYPTSTYFILRINKSYIVQYPYVLFGGLLINLDLS